MMRTVAGSHAKRYSLFDLPTVGLTPLLLKSHCIDSSTLHSHELMYTYLLPCYSCASMCNFMGSHVSIRDNVLTFQYVSFSQQLQIVEAHVACWHR